LRHGAAGSKIPQRRIGRLVLARLSRIPGVLFNILRGRVTARDAVYQLELSGEDAGVNEAVWSLRAGRPASEPWREWDPVLYRS
jgi:hypothetical protein